MDLTQRWRLLAPDATVLVAVPGRVPSPGEVRRLRALPAGTPVALAGPRRMRWLAWRGRVAVHAEYLVLPSLEHPVAITRRRPDPLRYTARTVLTVPSGITWLHLPVWLGIRLARAFPALLVHLPAGDRLLVGVRR